MYSLKKTLTLTLVALLVLQSASTSALTVTEAVNSLQSDNTSLPTGVTNPKGNIGFILSNIFWKSWDFAYTPDKNGKINPFYVDGLFMWTQSGSQTWLTSTTGSLGIGTTNPSSRLDVRGTVQSSANEILAKFARPDDAVNFTIENWLSDPMNGIRIGTRTAHSLVIQTNATERMRIDSAGNVGINTVPNASWATVTRPVRALQIGQSAAIVGRTDSNATWIMNNLVIQPDWSTKYINNGYGSSIGLYSDGKIYFGQSPNGTAGSTSAGIDAMVIDNSGNVGIGTTAPSYKLDVNGDLRVTGNIITSTGTVIDGSNITGIINAANVSAGTFGANTGGGNYSFLWNIWIGTTIPLVNWAGNVLHMHQPSTLASYVRYTNVVTWTGATDGLVYGLDSNEAATLWNYENTPMLFATNAAERMRIDPTGNIGIGTASPAYKLDVNGDVNLTGSIGISAGTPRSDRGINLIINMDNITGYGIYNSITATGTYSATHSNFGAYNAVTNYAQNGGYTNGIYGSYNYAYNGSTSTSTGARNFYGSYSYVRNNIASGNISNAFGGYFNVTNSTGSIANWYGIYIANVDGSTAAYGLYQYDTAIKNYFGGSLGIGQVPSTEKLEVNGNVKATAFLYSSDRRLKENIIKISSPLERIKKLNGYTFDWRYDHKKDIWVIAQEVEVVYPELVKTGKDGMKSVEYGNLIAPIIEAIKELSNKVDTLFVKYVDQQREIDELRSEIESIKTSLRNK